MDVVKVLRLPHLPHQERGGLGADLWMALVDARHVGDNFIQI